MPRRIQEKSPMFKIQNLFSSIGKAALTEDEVAELLKTTPAALATFEDSYKKAAMEYNRTSVDLFDYTKKEAGREELSNTGLPGDDIIDGIVEDLLHYFDPTWTPKIGLDEVNALPKELRPQLTGAAYCIDCDPEASRTLLFMYKKMLDAKSEKEKMGYYHHFRQGLDILDIDPLMYNMLGRNRNSMGFWFPRLKEAVDSQDFFKVPGTKIISVPLPILQMSRLDYRSLNPATLRIIDRFCMKAFDLDIHKTYFVKTGTYSSKFNFRNAKVTQVKEVREIGEYLLFLSNQASLMAGPLTQPSMYGVSTTNEWVVREYIEDVENNPCIYNGMPLHTEYRIFADFDTDEVLGMSPYWRPDVMLKRLREYENTDSPHTKHDYIIYQMHEPVLMRRYEECKDRVMNHIRQIVRDTDLNGQWSIDVMQNGNDFYIIDMATADTSALKDCVPPGKLKKSEENWLPEIPAKV